MYTACCSDCSVTRVTVTRDHTVRFMHQHHTASQARQPPAAWLPSDTSVISATVTTNHSFKFAHQHRIAMKAIASHPRQPPATWLHLNAMPRTELPPPLHLLRCSQRQRQQQRSAVARQQPVQQHAVLQAACYVDQHISCQQRAEPAERHLQGNNTEIVSGQQPCAGKGKENMCAVRSARQLPAAGRASRMAPAGQ